MSSEILATSFPAYINTKGKNWMTSAPYEKFALPKLLQFIISENAISVFGLQLNMLSFPGKLNKNNAFGTADIKLFIKNVGKVGIMICYKCVMEMNYFMENFMFFFNKMLFDLLNCITRI